MSTESGRYQNRRTNAVSTFFIFLFLIHLSSIWISSFLFIISLFIFIYLWTYQFIYFLFFCYLIHLFIYLFVYLFIYLFISFFDFYLCKMCYSPMRYCLLAYFFNCQFSHLESKYSKEQETFLSESPFLINFYESTSISVFLTVLHQIRHKVGKITWQE